MLVIGGGKVAARVWEAYLKPRYLRLFLFLRVIDLNGVRDTCQKVFAIDSCK